MTNPAELLSVSVDLARQAGALLRDGRDGAVLDIGTKSSPTDVVTAMDRAAEALIVEGLRQRRPGDGVLGEEGAAVPSTTGVRWVVDPLDGTVNYLYRRPAYAVSIAAEVDGIVVAGAVYDCERDAMYAAFRGGGATCNGAELRCSSEGALTQALVATGFSYSAQMRSRQAGWLTEVLPRVRDVRRGGSAALDLCDVASGRADAYYERGAQPWDHAAGALIAAEAGALVGGLRGQPAGEQLVLAAGPTLFGQLHDLLTALHVDAD